MAAAILGMTAIFAQAGPIAPGLPSNYFPIGAFYQPSIPKATTSFAGWKGRGINTLVGYEAQGTIPIEDYTAAAASAGLYLIREPSADPTRDTDPNVIAWLQPDEPEDTNHTAAELQDTYSQLQVANATLIANGALSSPRPVLINFAGAHMVGGYGGLNWASPKGLSVYGPYIQAADWVAQDIYPVTGWNQPNQLGVVGAATAKLSGWSNKPTFAYIETSNQRLFSNSNPETFERGPTPSEVRFEVWDAIIHGARGIFYFSQSFNGFRYDATPIDVAAEMTKQDAAINGIAAALNSTDTPDVSTVTFGSGSIEYITRSYGGITYLIALNKSSSTLTTTFSANFTMAQNGLSILGTNQTLIGNGNSFSDTFAPYGVRIYAEGAPGATPLAIPEPGALALIGVAPLLLGRRRRSASNSSRNR